MIKSRMHWQWLIVITLIAVLWATSASAKGQADLNYAPAGQLGNVIALTAGYDRTYAISADGTVWGWGDVNLEYEGISEDTTKPVDLTPVLGRVSAIDSSTGGQHDCALRTDGSMICWGLNDYGELGDGTTDYSGDEPKEVINLEGRVVSIALGFEHTCALMDYGGVKCWGRNANGQLGDGTTTDRLTPVNVVGLGSGVKALSAGHDFTCALTNDGQVKCWGNSDYIGIDQVGSTPTPVDIIGGIQSLSVGEIHACVLTNNGGVKCWGNWSRGALGVSETFVSADTPMDVIGLNSGVIAVETGSDQTCAITAGGGLKCWGRNGYGDIGIGTDQPQLLPVEVPGLERGVSLVAAGNAHTCAVVDNAVKCWGQNAQGQLGDGTTVDRWSPTGVAAGTGFRSAGPLTPEITTYIPTPLDVSTDPKVIGTNMFLAALLMLPFAVAAELFTRTLGAGEETLRRKFRPFDWLARFQAWLGQKTGSKLRRPGILDFIKLAGVMLFYGLVFSLLDRTWNPFSLAGLVLFASMTIAYGIVGIADDIVQWRVIKRWGLEADLTVRPTNILLAALSTAASRALSLVPGLMFGTPEALRTDESAFNDRQRGTLLKISALTFTLVGLIVWLPTVATSLLQRLSLPEMVGDLLGGIQAFLLVIFAVALENTFVQMMGFPGGFGEGLKRRSRWLWLGGLAVVTFIFLHTLLNPRGELAEAVKEGNVWLLFIVGGVFVVVTFTLWLFIGRRRKPEVPPVIAQPPAPPQIVGLAPAQPAPTQTPVPHAPPSAAAPQTVGLAPAQPAPTQTPVPHAPPSAAAPQTIGPAPAQPAPTQTPVPHAPPSAAAPPVTPVTPSAAAPPAAIPATRGKVEAISDGTKRCPNCGENIKAEARICRFCRATFDVKMMGYCLACHDIVMVSEGKCQKCGREVADIHVESRMLSAPPKPPAPRPEPAPAPVQAGIPPAVQAGTKQCPACGQTIKAEALICRFCHTRLSPGPAPAPAAAPVAATAVRPAPPARPPAATAAVQPAPPARPSQPQDTMSLMTEALQIIETKAVQYQPGMGYIKGGGTGSEAMRAAEKLGEAYRLRPDIPWLHYAYAATLHLAMQYKTGREEMVKLAQTHPEFLLAHFAISGWDAWEGLFLLPPWRPGITSVHPAISGALKTGTVLATREGVQPRATLFLRDTGGDFRDLRALQAARIDITTVISPYASPTLVIVYARIWDNPRSPYEIEALGLPFYPRGNAYRCKYEYLCLQENIDVAVINNRDQILLNKRLAMPPRMRQVNAQLLTLLQSEAGREISEAEHLNAIRAHQSRFSLKDVKY